MARVQIPSRFGRLMQPTSSFIGRNQVGAGSPNTTNLIDARPGFGAVIDTLSVNGSNSDTTGRVLLQATDGTSLQTWAAIQFPVEATNTDSLPVARTWRNLLWVVPDGWGLQGQGSTQAAFNIHGYWAPMHELRQQGLYNNHVIRGVHFTGTTLTQIVPGVTGLNFVIEQILVSYFKKTGSPITDDTFTLSFAGLSPQHNIMVFHQRQEGKAHHKIELIDNMYVAGPAGYGVHGQVSAGFTNTAAITVKGYYTSDPQTHSLTGGI